MKPTTDDLFRAVTIYCTADGTLTLEPLLGPHPGGYTGDWRDVAIDLLVEGKFERAASMIEQCQREREPTEVDRPERPSYSLPVFSVATERDGRVMIASVAQLRREPLPFSEESQLSPHLPREVRTARWYQVRDFGGDLDALRALTTRMAAIYARWPRP